MISCLDLIVLRNVYMIIVLVVISRNSLAFQHECRSLITLRPYYHE